MRRLLLVLAVIAAVIPGSSSSFDFGPAQAIHTTGSSLPACNANTKRDYIIVDPTSALDTGGGASALFVNANYLVCSRNEGLWKVLGSTFDAGGGSEPGVITIFGRSGNVLAQVGDYDISQITNGIAGSTLGGTGAGQGAALVGVRDLAGNFVGADVEAVLAELAATIASSGGATNLGTLVDPALDELTVTSDTGSNAVLPPATPTTPGVMTNEDKAKLDTIEAGAQLTDLTVTRDATSVTVNSSDGTEEAIPAATSSLAGVMTAEDRIALNGFVAGVSERSIAFPLDTSSWAVGECFLLSAGDLAGISADCAQPQTSFRTPSAVTVTGLRFVASGSSSGNVCDVSLQTLTGVQVPGSGTEIGSLTFGGADSDAVGETVVTVLDVALALGTGWQIQLSANGANSCSTVRGTISIEMEG